MFKLSTVCIDTASQSPAPLSDRIVNHMLAELFPFIHNPLTQFTNILGLLLIYMSIYEYLFQFSASLNNIWLGYNKKAKEMFFYETRCRHINIMEETTQPPRPGPCEASWLLLENLKHMYEYFTSRKKLITD